MKLAQLHAKPPTLVLTDDEARLIAQEESPRAALATAQESMGIPPHAPIVVDNGGQWLDGWMLWIDKDIKTPFCLVHDYGHGVQSVRHNCIG